MGVKRERGGKINRFDYYLVKKGKNQEQCRFAGLGVSCSEAW